MSVVNINDHANVAQWTSDMWWNWCRCTYGKDADSAGHISGFYGYLVTKNQPAEKLSAYDLE